MKNPSPQTNTLRDNWRGTFQTGHPVRNNIVRKKQEEEKWKTKSRGWTREGEANTRVPASFTPCQRSVQFVEGRLSGASPHDLWIRVTLHRSALTVATVPLPPPQARLFCLSTDTSPSRRHLPPLPIPISREKGKKTVFISEFRSVKDQSG